MLTRRRFLIGAGKAALALTLVPLVGLPAATEAAPAPADSVVLDVELTAADVRKAIRQLRRDGHQPFPDGTYHMIVHPDWVYNLQADAAFLPVETYSPSALNGRGEVGRVHGARLFLMDQERAAA